MGRVLRPPARRRGARSGATPESRHLAWPIPARIDKARLAHGRVLFVGDAAAATDVMTGEGIGQALLTGRLAAEAIVAGGDVAGQYTREVRRELVADHRMSVLLGRALEHRKGARAAIWIVGHCRQLGPTQLRPLDVRGRAAGDRGDPPPLAPPLPRPPRRLRRSNPEVI